MAMQVKENGSVNDLRAREHVCILLRVPESGIPWIDDLIRKARELDEGSLQVQGPDLIQAEREALANITVIGSEVPKPPKKGTKK